MIIYKITLFIFTQEAKKAASPEKNDSSTNEPLPFVSPPVSTPSSPFAVNGTSRLPPSQSPTITLLQKARGKVKPMEFLGTVKNYFKISSYCVFLPPEGHIPKGAMYIDDKIHNGKLYASYNSGFDFVQVIISFVVVEEGMNGRMVSGRQLCSGVIDLSSNFGQALHSFNLYAV